MSFSRSRNVRAGQDKPRDSVNELHFMEIEQQPHSGLCLRWEQEETKGTKNLTFLAEHHRNLTQPAVCVEAYLVNEAWFTNAGSGVTLGA